MNKLLLVLACLFAFFLISENVHAQTLYSDEESHGFLVYSGYSFLEGPASSVIAGVGYSVRKELDMVFEYSVLNYGLSDSGYWISQPESSKLYLGSITLYPFMQREEKSLTGQITVGGGWMVDNFNDGPILSISAALSGKSDLSDDIEVFPRFNLSYVPIFGQQLVKTVSIGFDVGISVGVSPEISLLINPLMSFDLEELDMTSGLVVGILL